MRTLTLSIKLLACMVALSIAMPLSAKQYNQSRTLTSRFQVKVNKAIAQGNRLKSAEGPTDTTAQFGTCGNININSVDAPRPGQPPIREQITVVTGDIINVVNRGCR